MRIAVVALTEQGIILGRQTAFKLNDRGHQAELYFPEESTIKSPDEKVKCHGFKFPLKDLMRDLFEAYDGILCLMALGIVVRVTAPLLQGKFQDPAVVVMDELGQNVISVLSGHWGRANDLTREIAGLTGAHPVITTATDVNRLPAIDVIARDHGLIPEPLEMIRQVNAEIVRGGGIDIFTEIPLQNKDEWGHSLRIKPFDACQASEENDVALSLGVKVIVTSRVLEEKAGNILYLRPRNIAAGIGCRRGVSKEEVTAAITEAFALAGRSLLSLKALASVDIKADEKGLLEAAEGMDIPISFYARDQIEQVLETRSQEMDLSETVQEKIGVGGVCEPAAVLKAGQKSKLLMTKKIFGRITVGLAEEN